MPSRFIRTVVTCLALALLAPGSARGDKKAEPKLQARFESMVQPFLKSHCFSCHGATKRRGNITLHELKPDPKDARGVATWEMVLEQLEIVAMPPEEREQPTPRQRVDVTDWIIEFLTEAGRGYRVLHDRVGNRDAVFDERDRAQRGDPDFVVPEIPRTVGALLSLEILDATAPRLGDLLLGRGFRRGDR